MSSPRASLGSPSSAGDRAAEAGSSTITADARWWLHCPRCGRDVAGDDPRTWCAACGGLLDIAHAPLADDLRGAALAHRFLARRTATRGRDSSGVWRFREMVLPGIDDVITYPEGNTPLIDSPAVARWAGVPGLALKHEGFNPTGSFKDRGMTVAITQARRLGVRAVACASTGNTSASLAAYAARAEIPAVVLVPAGQVALGKLAQSLAYGARTVAVRGDFDACLALARDAAASLGVHLVNSVNPFRIEGQKTIVLEMLEQCAWDAPAWIALPAGNLGNTAAFGRALGEAHAAGLIDRVPRLLAVQAAGAAPFARSFAAGFATRHRVQASTVATAIRIGDPASYDRAVRSIVETNGVVTAVSDDEIMDAKAVIDAAGVGCEPASAASVAGVRQLVRRGEIDAGARVVAVLTGHVLKDPGVLTEDRARADGTIRRANRPVEIDATLHALEGVLR